MLSAERSLCFGSSCELAIEVLQVIGGAHGLPHGLGKLIEGQKIVSCLLETSGHGRHQPGPLLDEGLVGLSRFDCVFGMDDLMIITRHLGSGMSWAVLPEVSELVYGATLDFGLGPKLHSLDQPLVSVCDHVTGGGKTSSVEILKEASPACGGLACGQLKGQEALVSPGGHPQHRKDRHTDYPAGKPHLQMKGIKKDDQVVLFGQVPTRPVLKQTLEPLDNAGDGAFGEVLLSEKRAEGLSGCGGYYLPAR